jgi:hypothetical protein
MIEILLLLLRALFGGAKLPIHEIEPTVEDVLAELTDPEVPETIRGQDIAPVPPESPRAPAPEPEPPVVSWGSASAIVAAMLRKGYRVFDGGDKDYNLNIVGVRNSGAKVDEYGCRMHVFWRYKGKVTHLSWKMTSYPGSHYLITKLLNRAGAAILVPGQWAVYEMDTHNGKYRALCQRRGPVRVYRDGNRDRIFDLDPSSIQAGMFGINVHAPITPSSGLRTYVANLVGSASAGCQVFQRLADFLEFRAICDHAEELWGNTFTYTLLVDSDVRSEDRGPVAEISTTATKFDALEEDWAPSSSKLGVRHRNLLNVKDGEDWLYMTGSDSRGHAIFPTYAKGLRAGIVNLRSYWVRRKLRSITAILSRWAPSSDTIGSIPGAPRNSPAAYSKFVAGRVGVGPNDALRLFDDAGKVRDADQLYKLVAAMVEYENESGLIVPRSIFDEAVRLI